LLEISQIPHFLNRFARSLIGLKSHCIKQHQGLSIACSHSEGLVLFGGIDFDNRPIHCLTHADQTFSPFEIIRFHNEVETSIADFLVDPGTSICFACFSAWGPYDQPSPDSVQFIPRI
jgi:hypothetical protein